MKEFLRKSINIKYAPPLLISLILLVWHFNFGILEGYKTILLALACSVLAVLILSNLIYGTWKNISSAYITGIS